MKIFSTFISIVALMIFVGCDDNTVGRDNNDPGYMFSQVGQIKMVNASLRDNVRYEIISTYNKMWVITSETQVYQESADFRGFDISEGLSFEPDQVALYYYNTANTLFAAPFTEYVIEKIYIYRLDSPTLPDITEDFN